MGHVFDGLRDFYSRKEGINSSPAFSAAAALSFMFSLNAVSFATLLDFIVHGHAAIAGWFVQHKIVTIAAGGAVVWAHVVLAKRSGLYFRSGPALSASWTRAFIAYMLITFLSVVACIAAAYSTRQDGL